MLSDSSQWRRCGSGRWEDGQKLEGTFNKDMTSDEMTFLDTENRQPLSQTCNHMWRAQREKVRVCACGEEFACTERRVGMVPRPSAALRSHPPLGRAVGSRRDPFVILVTKQRRWTLFGPRKGGPVLFSCECLEAHGVAHRSQDQAPQSSHTSGLVRAEGKAPDVGTTFCREKDPKQPSIGAVEEVVTLL